MLNGAPAKYDDPVILVGANEVYQARCRHCHQVPGKPALLGIGQVSVSLNPTLEWPDVTHERPLIWG